MGYVDKNLVSGERIIYMAKLHKAIFGPSILFGLWGVYVCIDGDYRR